MTKQDIVQEAYGENWETVKDYTDENGWVDTQIFCCKVSGITYEQIKKRTSLILSFHNRPISLKGIETNNGWIKIESEDSLPEQGELVLGFSKEWIDEDFNPSGTRTCHYAGIWPNLEWISAKWWDYHDTWINDEKTVPTHYQQIVYPKPPIH